MSEALVGEELGRVVMTVGSRIPPGPYRPLSEGCPSPSLTVPFYEMGARPGSQGCYGLAASKPLAFLRMREEERDRWEPVPSAQQPGLSLVLLLQPGLRRPRTAPVGENTSQMSPTFLASVLPTPLGCPAASGAPSYSPSCPCPKTAQGRPWHCPDSFFSSPNRCPFSLLCSQT